MDVRTSERSFELQPKWYMRPMAMGPNQTVEGFLETLDEALSEVFAGYSRGEDQTVLIGSHEVTQWVFRVPISDPFNLMDGSQFLATVLPYVGEIYVMIGSGIADLFPIETYTRIASTLEFL